MCVSHCRPLIPERMNTENEIPRRRRATQKISEIAERNNKFESLCMMMTMNRENEAHRK